MINHQYRNKAKAKAITRTESNWVLKSIIGLTLILSFLAGLAAQATTVRGAPDSFADLVEKLQPSVVNVSTIIRHGKKPKMKKPKGSDWFDNELLERFKDRYRQPREQRSLGSGFIISADGYVVTNNHVIKGADEITITTVDGEEYVAKVKGRAEEYDLALLKIKSDKKFPFVKWGDSDAARVGEWVLAIGNPYGFGGTVTAGIISGKNRRLGNGQKNSYENHIQTDASINRGNSGGPMFNMQGNVIGVNTVIVSPTGGNIGIGFSIPSADVKRVVDQLMKYGKTRRGWLGVSIGQMTRELAEAAGIGKVRGAQISDVTKDAPSDKAGMKVDDVIIKWDGIEINAKNTLPRIVAATPVGKKVKVEILRPNSDGNFEKETLWVVTGELKSDHDDEEVREDDEDDEDEYEEPTSVEGMQLSSINGEMRRRYRLGKIEDGVLVVGVERNSQAYRVGLRSGMIIQKVQYKEVNTPAEVIERIEDLRKHGKTSVVIYIVSPTGQKAHIPLKLSK